MNSTDNPIEKDATRFANKLGVIFQDVLQHFEIISFKGITFLPDMALHIGSFDVKEDFVRVTGQSDISDGIGFIFYNIFEDKAERNEASPRSKSASEPPYVRIFPYAIGQTLHLKKGTRTSYVSISVSAAYLKTFLQEEEPNFKYVFNSASNFWIEELMNDDILRTVNELVKKEEPSSMKSFYYKMKAMQLLFYLFERLKKRDSVPDQKLNKSEIEAVYKVRDKIVSSLSAPRSIAELKQIAGMNELKLRKIFKQIFGMGLYDYYQLMRMKEAARLLREVNLTVTEAGYQMGFENLGHFSKVFEKHIGKKPKKYLQSLKKRA